MEIIMRRVSDLTPYEKNEKKHNEKQIENVANRKEHEGDEGTKWNRPTTTF